jgi:hypothetical protein
MAVAGAANAKSPDARGSHLVFAAPKGLKIASIDWLSGSQKLAVGVLMDQGRPPTAIYFLDLTSRSWTRLALPVTQACPYRPASHPVALSPWLMGFNYGCLSKPLDPGRLKRPAVYDTRTRKIRYLVPYGVGPAAGGFSYAPGIRHGVIDDGDGLFAQLRWLQRDGLSAPLPVGSSWVGAPDWNPTGTKIAFPAAVTPTGVGVTRTFAKWALFEWDPATKQRRRLAGPYAYVNRGKWSPDGTRYGFVFYKDDDHPFLAVVDVRSRELRAVSAQGALGVAWIDSKTLAVSRETTATTKEGIYIIKTATLRHV